MEKTVALRAEGAALWAEKVSTALYLLALLQLRHLL